MSESTRHYGQIALIILGYVLCSCVPADAAVSKYSEYIAPCPVNDQAFGQCVKSAWQQIFNLMRTGVKEVGITKIDPMYVEKMTMNQGRDGDAMSLRLTLINATHTGMSYAKVTNVDVVPEKYKFNITFTIPHYEIDGQYDVNGKIVMIPVMGKGHGHANLTDVKVTWRIQGEKAVDKVGNRFLKLTKFGMDLKPRRLHFQFDNLFNGNKELGRMTNNVLNDQAEEIFKQMKPLMEKQSNQLMFGVVKRFFDKNPYNDIFPGVKV
ncbi:protein takeout [Bemisia tabaci]